MKPGMSQEIKDMHDHAGELYRETKTGRFILVLAPCDRHPRCLSCMVIDQSWHWQSWRICFPVEDLGIMIDYHGAWTRIA